MSKTKITDFYEAWEYLRFHKEFESRYGIPLRADLMANLDIDVVKVNPKTKAIDDDEELNTETNVWLELGTVVYEEDDKVWAYSHDIRLDCGAETFEKAVIKLANLFRKYYE